MDTRPNGVCDQGENGSPTEAHAQEMRAIPRAADFVRQAVSEIRKRPVLATAAAGTLGVVLGGLVVPGLGRLAFVATMGYFANELWRREGSAHVDELVAAFAGDGQHD